MTKPNGNGFKRNLVIVGAILAALVAIAGLLDRHYCTKAEAAQAYVTKDELKEIKQSLVRIEDKLDSIKRR
jgi:hypothetical protein